MNIQDKFFAEKKTGSGHAADSKMCYTIQFTILMLCAKYQEAGLCGSREKCDRNFLWRRRRKTTEVNDPYMSPPLKRAGNTINQDTSITVQEKIFFWKIDEWWKQKIITNKSEKYLICIPKMERVSMPVLLLFRQPRSITSCE